MNKSIAPRKERHDDEIRVGGDEILLRGGLDCDGGPVHFETSGGPSGMLRAADSGQQLPSEDEERLHAEFKNWLWESKRQRFEDYVSQPVVNTLYAEWESERANQAIARTLAIEE